MDLSNWNGIGVVQLGTPDPFGRHKVGGLKHTQMFHNPETGHRGQHLAKLSEWLTIAFSQGIQQRSAAVIGQCFEDFVHRGIM